MSKMYVANCTQQIQVFMYRLPESSRPFSQEIPIGGQIMVAGIGGNDDLGTQDVDAIVKQHEKYGMIKVDEIDRTRPFVGTCYSLDRQISVDKIRRGLEHNREVLIERGDEIQRHAAVGISNKIDQDMPGLKGLEVQAIELDNPKTGHTGEMSSAIRVDPNAPRDNKPGRRRRAA